MAPGEQVHGGRRIPGVKHTSGISGGNAGTTAYANGNGNKIPADQGISGLATGINQSYNASVFETLAVLDDTGRDPETDVAQPSEWAIKQAKQWVDENEL